MDPTTPISNTFIRSPPLSNQQQQNYTQNQRPPQSFFSNSTAPLSSLKHQQIAIPKQQQSLQRKQQQTPLLETASPLIQHNSIQKNLVCFYFIFLICFK